MTLGMWNYIYVASDSYKMSDMYYINEIDYRGLSVSFILRGLQKDWLIFMFLFKILIRRGTRFHQYLNYFRI